MTRPPVGTRVRYNAATRAALGVGPRLRGEVVAHGPTPETVFVHWFGWSERSVVPASRLETLAPVRRGRSPSTWDSFKDVDDESGDP